MLRTTLLVSICVLGLVACKKKKEDEGGGTAKTTDKGGGDKGGGDDKPKEMSATDLWNDYNKPGQDGMALLNKWKAGVVVTGPVKTVVSESSFWLDGAGHNVQVDFTDGGAAAKAKGVKAGDTITAQCKIGGSDGSNLMMLTDCTLK